MEDVKGTYVVDSKGIFAENRGYFRRNFRLRHVGVLSESVFAVGWRQ
jgi:hypothetical protein